MKKCAEACRPRRVWGWGGPGGSSRLVNSCCTAVPPNSPGGRLIECSTIRSTGLPGAGRGPWLGDGSLWAKRCQPPSHGPAASGRASVDAAMWLWRLLIVRDGDVQALDAVADLAHADAQPDGGRAPVEARFAQCAHQYLALMLVEPGLQVARQRHRGAGVVPCERVLRLRC